MYDGKAIRERRGARSIAGALRRAWVLGLVAGTAFLAGTSVAVAAPALTQVGSPSATGATPYSVAFSPNGALLATANEGGGTVSMFTVSATGALVPLGSTATGAGPFTVAFSPDGRFLATANYFDNTVSMFTVAPSGALTRIGSPIATGARPDSVAFSPNGQLLATASQTVSRISMFTVSTAGALASIGAATATGNVPVGVAFSPNGALLATVDYGANTVSVFTASAAGALTLIGTTTTGRNPNALAFSPSGNLLTTADQGDNAVSVFAVSTGGALNPRGQTPTGTTPNSVAFSPGGGGLLASANSADNTVSLFAVSANGALIPVGSPIATGNYPLWVAFSPRGGLLATANLGDNTVSVLAGSDPVAQITSPAGQQVYSQGQTVTTGFACTAPAGSWAIRTCADSTGASTPSGVLDTSTPGDHAYTVTATSSDGQARNATITYSVTAAPRATALPAIPTLIAPETIAPATPTAPPGSRITEISASAATIVWCHGTGCRVPATSLRFSLDRPTRVRLVLRTRAHGHFRWSAATILPGYGGANRDRIAGRWHGRLIPAGPVELLVQVERDHWTTVKTVHLTVSHTTHRR